MNDGEGAYEFLQLGWLRSVGLALSCFGRTAIAVLLIFYGTRYLAYTFRIEDLLLNAVALEFVISIDELMFEALVPMQVKLLIANTRLASLGPPKTFRGVGWRSFSTLAYMITMMLITYSQTISPQYTTLVDAVDAVCAGDREFVYTLDGVGAMFWGYGDNDLQYRQYQWLDPDYPDYRPWKTEAADVERTYAEFLLDRVLSGHGRSVNSCPLQTGCYIPDPGGSGFPVPLTDGTAPDCCLVLQTNVPIVDAGKFSLVAKSTETLLEAGTV